MKPKIVYNGLAGLKHFIQSKISVCVEQIQTYSVENNDLYKTAYTNYKSVPELMEALEKARKELNVEFCKGKYFAYKDVIDLIEAFEKANAENEGIE